MSDYTQVPVDLGDRSYAVTIGPGALSDVGAIVASRRAPTSAALVTNPTVARHYSQTVLQSLSAHGIDARLLLVAAGERSKTLANVERLYNWFLDMGLDRGGAVIALGGGVIGDLAGFAAATYMRGVDFHQIPTTLLAQVDASVGGKTGVDLPRGKNLVGAFHQPRSVTMDTRTLDTLPARELRCGLAEVVKHGIIYDQAYFRFVASAARHLLAREETEMVHAVQRSVEIKRDVVQADERESGLRAILNCGHTIAHAVEVVGGYGHYSHGEAVSIGLVTEAIIAEHLGLAENGLAKEIACILSKLRLPVGMGSELDTNDIVRAVALDKKTLGGAARFALPERIGQCRIVEVPSSEIARGVEEHRRLFT